MTKREAIQEAVRFAQQAAEMYRHGGLAVQWSGDAGAAFAASTAAAAVSQAMAALASVLSDGEEGDDK